MWTFHKILIPTFDLGKSLHDNISIDIGPKDPVSVGL